MYSYVPNAIIVARACQLWVRMLAAPKYDNGETDPFRRSFASVLVERIPKNNEPSVLERFEECLYSWLIEETKYDHDNKRIVKHLGSGHYENNLHVDYGPDMLLHQAAEEAGLKMEFPWKTNMWLHHNDVAVRNGYGAPEYFHHPLDEAGQQWCVTTMRGTDEDNARLLDSVRYLGNPLGLEIDNEIPKLLGKSLLCRN